MQVDHYPIDSKPSRKGKERDSTQRDLPHREPQPTDLDEKLTALRRRTAGVTRPRERPERDRMATLVQTSTQVSLSKPSSSITRTDRSPKLAVLPPVNRHSPTSPRRHASPHVIVSRPSQDADHEDFSRLKISSPSSRPPQPHKPGATSKLFNPNTDPIPMRRTTEPESMSDGTGSSHAHASRPAVPGANHRDDRGNAARQLFDHRKDDPVRFSVLSRPQLSGQGRSAPTPKHSGDYVSASSTSSYAASISSSAFTLSSTTDGSSTSSALFEGRPNQGTEDSGNNVFSVQLKRLYRDITNLENKIKQEDSVDEADDGMNTRVMLKGKEVENEELERERWKKQIVDHKQLAENMHNLLDMTLAPSVPASLRNIATKYNIIVRLWTYAFHKLLESLRRASLTSPLALEHLQDFIYYAYTFYTGLLEEPTLSSFKSGWLEALGDLARYRMAVAAWVGGSSGGQGGLTIKAISDATDAAKQSGADESAAATPGSPKSVSDAPAARIDDSPSPSIGVAAARLLEVEPEKERWRNIARDWYGTGLAEQPGTGKLHHHLGLLSREGESEELRAVYHFVKSLTTLHPFATSRESILNMWSSPAQGRRSVPDARASDLFVLLHGMIFTNIQLDDFQPSLARLIERLEIEGAEERDWIMMAIINIGSIFEYGKQSGLLRRVGCVGTKEINGPQIIAAMRGMSKKAAVGANTPASSLGGVDEERMDVDEEQKPDVLMKSSPLLTKTDSQNDNDMDIQIEQPQALKYAMQLSFVMLSHVLRHPTRKASEYSQSNLNPYLTIMLTFLATILKHKPTLDIMERSIPWSALASFFATIPRKIMISQGLMPAPGKPQSHRSTERWAMLSSGCTPPLPEDWCLRGMEWVGRKVYERGFWKSDDDQKAELTVLETVEGRQLTDGTIEDDDGEDGSNKNSSSGSGSLVRRWVRIARSAINIANTVDGFDWKDGTREWVVEGKLAEKVARWTQEDEAERQEEERRRMGKRWVDDAMDVDDDAEISSEDSDEDDENDSEEIKALKARRKYLKEILQTTKQGNSVSSSTSRVSRPSRRAADLQPLQEIIPGYTILVIDTNILLSSLSMVSSLIESYQWTVVVPLPVIMELDGLAINDSELGNAAQAALAYVSTHVRTHSVSLKVQTSRGNYLTSLNVRAEEIDFHGDNAEKSMDDLILKAAIWQDDHWVDRSAMLKAPAMPSANLKNAIKVVLLSLDRNLRLKARSRQLAAANEKDLASLLATTT